MAKRDPVLLNSIANRDISIPEDIVIPAKYNAVDDRRHVIPRSNNSPFAMAGPGNYGQSVVQTVQRALSEGRIVIDIDALNASQIGVTPSGNLTSTDVQSALEELQTDIDNIDGSETQVQAGTNVTVTGSGTIAAPYIINSTGGSSSGPTFAEILNASNTLVQTTYFGDNAPTCTLSGTNNSQVNFVVPSGTVPLTFTVFATSSELDAGNKVIVFSGAGLLGNTSNENIYIPQVQKTDMSAIDFGALASGNPAALDLDNNPSISVIGVGTVGTPSLTLRFNSLSTYTKYNLIFKW